MKVVDPKLSRRGFIKSAAAVGAAGMIYGCSKSNDDAIYYGTGGDSLPQPPDLETNEFFYGTGGHNCGAKCLIKGWVKNGRIIRMTSSEDEYAGGVWQDPNSHNNTQSRACARCRGYRHRLYHPGRLKYPLKQTRKRGDLSGFVRISWEQALNEITRKHKAVIDTYGPEAVNSLYSCGNYSGKYQGGGANGPWNARNGTSVLFNILGGATGYFSNYSFHQQGTFGTFFTGYGAMAGDNPTANTIASLVNTVVLWGSNCYSTVNSSANSGIQSYKKMRARGGKVIFIGPYLSDQGINSATEWIQIKPYTDAALICGMLHEMIVKTFDSNGGIMQDAWLNPDYLDIMAHGFFDSPGYWLEKTPGNIIMNDENTNPGMTYVWINPVPPGKSLSAYIMGSDNRLTKARYDAGNNYTAQQFSTSQTFRNADTCSYTVTAGSNTKYLRKKDYNTPKTPEWASAITGVPAAKIRELAKIYCTPAAHPLYSEYSGGQQKQAEGVNNMFAIQTLNIITQTYGRPGETISRAQATATSTAVATENNMPDWGWATNPAFTNSPKTPFVSCTMWHNAIKFGFGDQLKANGYTAKYIPDWNANDIGTGKAYHDDGGAKALVQMKRNPDGSYVVGADGYYEWETDASGKPIYTGYRFIMNAGGNIPINQHQNANDSADMLAALPLGSLEPDNPDTFCIVNFDNFLSPSPRWSDYVLPAATVWEMGNRIDITLGNSVVTPVVTPPPGESKDTWSFAVEYMRAYERIDPLKAGAAANFIGTDPGETVLEKLKIAYESSGHNTNTASKFYGKTFDEALKVQYSNRTPLPQTAVSDSEKNMRTSVRTYLALSADTRRTTAFTPNIADNGGSTGNGGNMTYGSASNSAGNVVYPNDVTIPNVPGKAILYSERYVFQYENRFRIWHGYLPASERGQKNIDPEGDPIILPIMMYFPHEDYFMEAYAGQLPPENNRFLLTTTHDRFRSHSTLAEAPYLREITHRVRGGGLYSGNDWGTYALSEIGPNGEIPRHNKSIAERDFKRASWTEIWMNDEDGATMGINDGDLIEVSNVIGAVRVIARLTKRNVRGFLDLHQGCWFDPDPVDGVDDGGCANTLMATKPSRYDHGNGQQSAMVSVRKVTEF